MLWVVRVGGNDGELRPWHCTYVVPWSESALPSLCSSVWVSVSESI